jgi:formate hydrogenlyase transcriptional activator
MRWEKVPPINLFKNNTAAFVHELPAEAISNAAGESNYVRVQVLTPVGVLDREKQLGVVRELTDIVDIPLLVEYLVDRYAKQAGKRIRSIGKRTLKLFQSYDWPGNVRELQNVIERAVILCDGETFHVDASWLKPTALPVKASVAFAADVADREKAMIEDALLHSKGLIAGPSGAAAKLGLPRQTLESKIKKLRIDRYRYKTS